MTFFLRVLDASVDEKPVELLRAVASLHDDGKYSDAFQRILFEREPSTFAEIPGSPFAYWVNDQVRGVFGRFEGFEAKNRTVKQGLATTDDFRFVRAWWEIDGGSLNERWFGLAKGGAFSPFYADVFLVVDWRQGGAQSWAIYQARKDVVGGIIKNPDFYFRPGLTWPLRTNGLSFRPMPAGCIFGHKGPAAFTEDNSGDELLSLCAILNSQCFGYLVGVQLARTELAQSYEVGLIQQTPVPDLSVRDAAAFASLARRAWTLKRMLDATNEVSHAFVLPPGMFETVAGTDHKATENTLVTIQREIDEHVYTLYGIGREDQTLIETSAKRGSTSIDGELTDLTSDDVSEDDAPAGVSADAILSWLLGVAFGRFDVRLATGVRSLPTTPEPFDPLPSRSPGMWPVGEQRYELFPGILVDDVGHNDDVAAHVADVAANTGWPDPSNLRQWLAREFFPLHIKMYSKSRRKAPIYWQIATPSASYSIWLYIHAFTNDTLFRVQNDYVGGNDGKLAHEERRLESMARELREKSTTADRKALAAQEGFVDELRAFLDEVKRVAPLWKPSLDDGVIINFAPLWRLVPQHKAWQKELKATWDALCEGKYDWAHLAMHLWPERVVPKCATDRSFAIAHGLEDVFWVEGSDGKWTARKAPTRPVEELVEERTSAAVKAALKSLLEAPVAAGGGKKARKGKKHA